VGWGKFSFLKTMETFSGGISFYGTLCYINLDCFAFAFSGSAGLFQVFL